MGKVCPYILSHMICTSILYPTIGLALARTCVSVCTTYHIIQCIMGIASAHSDAVKFYSMPGQQMKIVQQWCSALHLQHARRNFFYASHFIHNFLIRHKSNIAMLLLCVHVCARARVSMWQILSVGVSFRCDSQYFIGLSLFAQVAHFSFYSFMPAF